MRGVTTSRAPSSASSSGKTEMEMERGGLMDGWVGWKKQARRVLSPSLSLCALLLPSPDFTIAMTGWYSPDAVIIREKRWTPPPLIHIINAKKATLLADPVARDVIAAWFRAKEGVVDRGVVARAEVEVEGGAAWEGRGREARLKN